MSLLVDFRFGDTCMYVCINGQSLLFSRYRDCKTIVFVRKLVESFVVPVVCREFLDFIFYIWVCFWTYIENIQIMKIYWIWVWKGTLKWSEIDLVIVSQINVLYDLIYCNWQPILNFPLVITCDQYSSTLLKTFWGVNFDTWNTTIFFFWAYWNLIRDGNIIYCIWNWYWDYLLLTSSFNPNWKGKHWHLSVKAALYFLVVQSS